MDVKTRGEQMLALRRARMTASPAFLRGGFRPFFFGGAVWAVAALSIWLFSLATGTQLPSTFDPLAWHRHEMLFGFVGAIVAGFLLTAIPNWTGRLPVRGLRRQPRRQGRLPRLERAQHPAGRLPRRDDVHRVGQRLGQRRRQLQRGAEAPGQDAGPSDGANKPAQ